MATYEWVEKNGCSVRGKRECLKVLSGDHFTRNDAIVAKCFECNGWGLDGKSQCTIKDCALYEYSPYK